MPRKQSLLQAVANALVLKRYQVADICCYGDIMLSNKTQGIREVKAVELTLTQASEIWGFSTTGGMLKRHAKSGKLKVVNAGPHQKYNPRMVTVAAMLDLMEQLDDFTKRQRGRRG